MFRMIPSCLTVLVASLVMSNTTDEEWNLCQMGPCDCYDMGAVLTKTVTYHYSAFDYSDLITYGKYSVIHKKIISADSAPK